MAWVYMALKDSDAEAVRFPDDPEVVEAQKARGYVEVSDEYAAESAAQVEPDEVDIHGQGWVTLVHPDFPGGSARFPVEVVADQQAKGWKLPSEVPAPVVGTESTVAELQAQLKKLGLPVSGTKAELIDRLNEYDEDAPVEPDTEEQ